MQHEKNAIKETIAKMTEEKDKELALLAQSTLETLKETDKDYETIHTLIMRNKELYEREL